MSASNIKLLFPELTVSQCIHLVHSCKNCAPLAPLGPLQQAGVNPRGLAPNKLQQVDVTHTNSFGKLKFVHVVVDTYSKAVFATAQSGEKARNAIKAVKSAMLVLGVPWTIKTDNGPAYTSQEFNSFLKYWNMQSATGIPYNPQGQAIIERTHRTIKDLLQRQKNHHMPPDPQLALTEVLFTINFLTFDSQGISPAYKHWGSFPSQTPAPMVRWKDPLTGEWKGPHPLLTKG